MSKCTYNYNGVEYSELEFKKILKDLELPLSELSQEDLNLFKEHVMFIHDIQNYRLLNRYTVIHNNGYYDTAIRKVLIPVDSINKENILANIIKFKGLNPLFNLYHLFNEHTIKLIDSTPEIDSKDRLYEYRLAMLLQNNVENTWLNKLLLDLQIGINNTLNTNYDLEVIKNFLSHNINIVESQTVLPDTTESIDVESLLNQLGLDGKTEFEQEPNVEIVDFVTEIRQLANTDISNIQTQNQNKSNELIRLYRIENTNILYDESREGIVSKREIIGQFFTDSINTVANYLKKNQKEDGINLVYVDIPKSDLDKYHVSNNEFSKTMDVESDNWIIPQSIARNYVDLSSVTKVTGNFLTLNKAKKELTEIINNLPEPKLNNNFIGNFSAEGRGTFEGDGKDKAMRNQAVGFIGELNPNKEDRFDSSTYGSFKHFNNNSIEEERYLENVPEDTSNGNKIMLALNGSIADTDILQKTKDKILELHNRGFEFLVGDMPGGENRIGDDKFINYLKSIGANFTVFGSGNSSRLLYQRVELTEQQRQNIQELKQLEPAYAVASDEKVQEFIDTIYPEIETQFNKEQITNLNSPETINKFNEFIGRIDYQLVNQESIIATEKTIRDLAARISDRIGIPYKIISDRTQEFKGKLENGVAVINLAYATLDTSIHEILGHPIIRAIKETNKTLFNNLLKELEYGRGKDILDRIKRDYVIKYNYPIFNTEIIKVDKVYRILNTKNNLLYAAIDFKSEEDALKYINVRKKEYSYTLEEQQEEAIVELLGMMTAEKLDNVKDGKLISLLKRLLKEMKQFVRTLLNQKEVNIDNLPDNITINDLADLLAYSNSKLILPGYEVEYTTPDDKKFKTYAEASNHISELAKNVQDVDLNNVNINIIENKDVVYFIKSYDNGTDADIVDYYVKLKDDYYVITPKAFNNAKDFLNDPIKFLEKVKETKYSREPIKINSTTFNKAKESANIEFLGLDGLKLFIEKNKEYEQSKEIIEEWKKVNNIQYNPEEIYSRGQEFVSVVGAYSSFDVNLMMQNLLQHIQDNEKAGGKFAISAFTKPIDKNIGHLESGGGKIKFKIYPKSEDILWATNRDAYSGSVWDASEKINKDKKSELLGVTYIKYPSLNIVTSVKPNLIDIVNLVDYHNELGIVLTGNNFRLEYDNNIPYQTKKIIDGINSILDQKYGKLVKPIISSNNNKTIYRVISEYNIIKDFYDIQEAELFVKEHNDIVDETDGMYYDMVIVNQDNSNQIQTENNLQESIENVKYRILYGKNTTPITKEIYDSILSEEYNHNEDYIKAVTEGEYWRMSNGTYFYETYRKEKEYTEQALINLRVAKLKEVTKKYPRILIRSEVKKINEHQFDELSFFQKIPINVEKLFEDEKFANEIYESLGYKNDTTLPDDNKVHKILSDINKQHHLGNIIDLDGYPIYNSEDIIFQNGLKNITSNQWGHGATRIPYGKKGIERLENILSKSDRFTGDFGPIAGTELAKINQYPNTWESGRFIITRDDKDFYDKDGSLNINNIEIILNRSFEPYGNYLANKYPNIIFKDVFGNIIKISNQLTPKQKQEAIHLYSQYLKQNPNSSVEQFKSWVEEFNKNNQKLNSNIQIFSDNKQGAFDSSSLKDDDLALMLFNKASGANVKSIDEITFDHVQHDTSKKDFAFFGGFSRDRNPSLSEVLNQTGVYPEHIMFIGESKVYPNFYEILEKQNEVIENSVKENFDKIFSFGFTSSVFDQIKKELNNSKSETFVFETADGKIFKFPKRFVKGFYKLTSKISQISEENRQNVIDAKVKQIIREKRESNETGIKPVIVKEFYNDGSTDILKYAIELIDNPIIKNAVKNAKNIKVVVFSNEEFSKDGVAAWYQPNTNSIYIYEENLRIDRGAFQLLAHELIHGVTHISINYDNEFKNEINRLLEEVKNKTGKKYQKNNEDSIYGLKDEHEFLSEAFSNPLFKQLLESIKDEKETNLSLWQKFVNLIFNLFKKESKYKTEIYKISTLDKLNSIIHINNFKFYNKSDDSYSGKLESLSKFITQKSQERLNAIQEVFNQNPELSEIGDVFSYASYLDTIFPDSKVEEMDDNLYISVLNQLEQENKIEKDCTGKGKLKAEKGLQTNFTKGGKWEIYEIFEGKSHKQGGIDINIKNNQISFTNKNGSIKAKYGLVISKDS